MTKKDRNQLIVIYTAVIVTALFACYCYHEWTKPIYKGEYNVQN